MDAEARNLLRNNESYSKLLKRGGAWWLHAQEWIAKQNGDTAKLDELKSFLDAQKRELAAIAAALRALSNGL